MKSSKFFLSTLIAASAMVVPAYATGEIVGINFNSGQGSVTGWNNTTDAGGTVANLVDTNGESTGMSLSYSCANTWGDPGNTDAVLKGYLDDNNISVSVSGISYLSYDLTVIAASDQGGGVFRYYTVNNVNYYGSEGVGIEGTNTWGNTDTGTLGNDNSFVISNLSGDISLTTPGRNSSERSCLAGLVITNSYAGTAASVALSGTGVDWTASAIGSVSWTNSAADAGTYAAFNLTADTAVNVSAERVTTDAITANGSGVLTLSGNEIELINAGTIRTDSDTASVVVNNDLKFSSYGNVSGNVTLNGKTTFTNGGNLSKGAAIGANAAVSVTGGTLLVEEISGTATVAVSESATLEITKITGDVNALLDYSNVSGAGTLSLALNTENGQGVSASNLTGTLFVSGSGRFQLNQTTLGTGAKVKFADGADMVLNGAMTEFSHDMTLTGSTELYFNNVSSSTVKFSGSLTGGTLILQNANTRTLELAGTVALAGLSVSQNKTVKFTGEGASVGTVTLNSNGNIGGTASVENLHLSDGVNFSRFAEGSNISVTNAKATSGTGTISGNLTLSGSLWVGNATLNLDSGANVTADKFRIAEQASSTANINSGATLTITGNENGHSTAASLLLSHWSYTSSLNLNGGILNAENAEMKMGWAGAGTFSAQSGEARLSGLNFWAEGVGDFKGNFILGAADSGDAKVYLGASGMKDAVSSDNVSIVLGNGTLGALDSWSSSANGTPVEFQLVGTVGGTVFNTEDPDDATAHTITINHSMTGDGKLAKDGAGTLKLMKDSTYSGGTTILAGTLVAASANALGSGDIVVAQGAELEADAEITLSQDLTVFAGGENVCITQENNGSITLDDDAMLYIDLSGVALPTDESVESLTLNIAMSGALFVSEKQISLGSWNADLSEWTEALYEFQWNSETGSLTLTLAIPEPSMFGLLAGLGALALVGTRRRRGKKA